MVDKEIETSAMTFASVFSAGRLFCSWRSSTLLRAGYWPLYADLVEREPQDGTLAFVTRLTSRGCEMTYPHVTHTAKGVSVWIDPIGNTSW
jgi:hypothetical protein